MNENYLKYKNDKVNIIVYTALSPCFDDFKSRPGSCGNNYLEYMIFTSNNLIHGPIKVGGKGFFSTRSINVVGRATCKFNQATKPIYPKLNFLTF